jgi:hypothetical protein
MVKASAPMTGYDPTVRIRPIRYGDVVPAGVDKSIAGDTSKERRTSRKET